MIKVFIPNDKEFQKYKIECKKLYEKLQPQISDDSSFEFICNKTFFYIFVNENGLIGAIYYFLNKDGKLFLNGFSKRKHFLDNLYCLKLSTTWFYEDIYAEAQNRASALCLIKCGFKRVRGILFVREHCKQERCSRKDVYDV